MSGQAYSLIVIISTVLNKTLYFFLEIDLRVGLFGIHQPIIHSINTPNSNRSLKMRSEEKMKIMFVEGKSLNCCRTGVQPFPRQVRPRNNKVEGIHLSGI